MSFQEILNSSLSGQVNSSAVSYNSCENAYDEFFQKAADTYHISVDLLKAVAKQESGFQSNIVSSAGAIGIMQLMPSTAEYLGVTNPYDPEQNIMGGAKLLSELYERYNGNLDFTLAAYNAGAGSVDNYGGVPPYSETQNFITKVKSYMGIS
ncbi:MAG: lytic transglycosylase domain-containing protein [Lachnospiraceae bacterium]|nr:lytic transglycosylase domain-containing protein [Lachnospiraceae bacterium]MBP3507620.1 lytic transglycosylase domain-containing protein [Lachnospiraceae bacterium]